MLFEKWKNNLKHKSIDFIKRRAISSIVENDVLLVGIKL